MTKVRFQTLPRWFRDFIPLIFWMALIFMVSSRPILVRLDNEVARRIFFKLAHIITYALLAWFWWRALTPHRQVTWLFLSIAVVLTIIYGISDEIHQLYVPGRFSRVADVLFDTGGALAMILLLRRYEWPRYFPENLFLRVGLGVKHPSKILD